MIVFESSKRVKGKIMYISTSENVYGITSFKISLAVIVPIISLSLFFFTANAKGQESYEKFLSSEFKKSFPVKVTVAESRISGLVKSYIKRELRSLGDVKIVESAPFYEIQILANSLLNKNGDITGVALSTIFIKPYNVMDLKDATILSLQQKDLISHAGVQEIERIFEYWDQAGMVNINEYKGHILFIGADNDLKELCEKIVADFDNDCLELPRQLKEKLKEQLNIK